MTRVEAIGVIIRDAQSDKSSTASLKRLRRAMKVLYLSPDEQREVALMLHYLPKELDENGETH